MVDLKYMKFDYLPRFGWAQKRRLIKNCFSKMQVFRSSEVDNGHIVYFSILRKFGLKTVPIQEIAESKELVFFYFRGKEFSIMAYLFLQLFPTGQLSFQLLSMFLGVFNKFIQSNKIIRSVQEFKRLGWIDHFDILKLKYVF